MRIAAVVVGLAGLALVYAHAQDKVVLEDFLEQPPLPPPLNLPLIAPERVPETGNFYSAGREWPPLPFNPYADETNVPVYSLGAAMGKKANAPFYLFDDRAVVAFEELALAAAEARAAADPKAKGLSRTEPAGPQSAGRGVVPTGTDLLLDIEDVTNGVISLKIYNPDAMTNNPVWDVWAATKFSGNPDNWTWIVRTEPGQTNLLVTMLSETQGYLRLGATNNTHSASNILDSWMSQNFGHVLEWSSDHTGATNDSDSDGVNNYDEFMAGTDPNSFSFTAHFPSLFVNQQTIYGTCAVQGGVPFAMAVLVNRTNVTPGDWLPYSANFSATLGSTDGAYAVRVLLRGRPADATPVFNDTEITLDRVAPVVVIKNPEAASATVTRPYLQLLGNANEPLAALTYDIGNAAGTRTNLPVSVIDQAFNTNSFDFTTNYFQAYDVALATNANNITLRVTDRAGNMTTTNLTVTLDYTGATNSPVLQLTWPTNGMSVSGESFYVRGQINDETASLSAQIVDVNGVTNDYAGLIERNGTLWAEGLPLAEGTNVIQLTATDAAGNISKTTLTVIKSDVALTTASTPDGESLYDGTGTVSGTVPDAGWSVTVNGVAATVDSGGNWTAENVPIYGEGTATFDVVATPTSGPTVRASVTKEKPAIIKVTKHFLKQAITAPTYSQTWLKDYRLWADDSNGVRRFRYRGTASMIGTSVYPSGDYNYDTEYSWSDTNAAGIAITTFGSGGSVTGAISSPLVMTTPDQQLDHTESDGSWTYAFYVYHYYAKGVRHEWPGTLGSTVETLAARTEQTLFTGGKSGVGRQTLFSLGAEAIEYGKPEIPAWYHTPAALLPPEPLSLLGRPLDAESKVWPLVADNSKAVLGFAAVGVPNHSGNVAQQGVRLALKSVTFEGASNDEYHDVLCDTNGLAYPGAHWEKNLATHKVTSHPALFVSGSKMAAKVRFAVQPSEVNTEVVVVGMSRGHVFRGQAALSVGAGELEVPVLADTALLTNVVDFLNPLAINWAWATTNNLLAFTAAGTSSNQVYVTWDDPKTPYLYHTAVHLACNNTGGNTADTVVSNTWRSFASGDAPANVTAWDGTNKLYYYRAGFPATNAVLSAADLLASTNHNGQCGAWQELMMISLAVNGVPSSDLPGTYKAHTEYAGTVGRYFLIEAWNFGPQDTNNPAYPWRLELGKNASGGPMMVSSVAMSGTVTNGIGVAGQNSATPAEKIFSNHQIVQYIKASSQVLWYDPSYGKVYNSIEDFYTDSVAGFAQTDAGNPNTNTIVLNISQP